MSLTARAGPAFYGCNRMLNVTIRKNDASSYRTTVLELPEPENTLAEKLMLIGIGMTLEKNCLVVGIDGDEGSLQSLCRKCVNADELQYLARRMNGFDNNELQSFYAVLEAEKPQNLKDMINLACNLFCYTVVSDFSNLDAVGKMHLANKHGGMFPPESVPGQFEAAAYDLLATKGIVTSHGVVYPSGLPRSMEYNGKQFPAYIDHDYKFAVTILPDAKSNKSETLFLPCWDVQISKALMRLGLSERDDAFIEVDEGRFNPKLRRIMMMDSPILKYLPAFNGLARCYVGFTEKDIAAFEAIVDYAQPSTPEEAVCLAENYYEFISVPDVHTPEEYAKHVIEDTCRFGAHSELCDYIDYKRYGEDHVRQENGQFTNSVILRTWEHPQRWSPFSPKTTARQYAG